MNTDSTSEKQKAAASPAKGNAAAFLKLSAHISFASNLFRSIYAKKLSFPAKG